MEVQPALFWNITQPVTSELSRFACFFYRFVTFIDIYSQFIVIPNTDVLQLIPDSHVFLSDHSRFSIFFLHIFRFFNSLVLHLISDSHVVHLIPDSHVLQHIPDSYVFPFIPDSHVLHLIPSSLVLQFFPDRSFLPAPSWNISLPGEAHLIPDSHASRFRRQSSRWLSLPLLTFLLACMLNFARMKRMHCG